NINSEKMSKSLGNFFTIKEVLERFDSEVLRFFLLSAHYRSPIDFSDKNLEEAAAALSRIYTSLAEIDGALFAGKGGVPVEAVEELREKVENFGARFTEAMDDDFNTAAALAGVFELVRAANRVMAECSPEEEPRRLLLQARERIDEAGRVLGLFATPPAQFLARMQERKLAESGVSPEEIGRLVQERAEARKAKDFRRSDEIRDMLLARGIELLDRKEGTTWRLR
ncbi:MAG TPA: DALR domain-containing protein, partial [Verrucomicrobiae bacterium]|nr:DALR domain-containing protein [Verrucomicrobiae bacterium]